MILPAPLFLYAIYFWTVLNTLVFHWSHYLWFDDGWKSTGTLIIIIETINILYTIPLGYRKSHAIFSVLSFMVEFTCHLDKVNYISIDQLISSAYLPHRLVLCIQCVVAVCELLKTYFKWIKWKIAQSSIRFLINTSV